MNLNIMEIATRKVVAIDKETPVDSACTLLASSRIKKLPVTSEGELVGTLSRADIMRSTMSKLATASSN